MRPPLPACRRRPERLMRRQRAAPVPRRLRCPAAAAAGPAATTTASAAASATTAAAAAAGSRADWRLMITRPLIQVRERHAEPRPAAAASRAPARRALPGFAGRCLAAVGLEIPVAEQDRASPGGPHPPRLPEQLALLLRLVSHSCLPAPGTAWGTTAAAAPAA